MELFRKAKTVRLRSCHEKYLLAHPDGESVLQHRNGNSSNAIWIVEHVPNKNAIRLKSCFYKYLTASDEICLLGVAGRKVIQTSPAEISDYSLTEWEPIRDGMEVKLMSSAGHFLRANGGLPPIRNSVTHDTPRRSSTQVWILWYVENADNRQLLEQVSDDLQSLQSLMSPPRYLSEEEEDAELQDEKLIYYSVIKDKEDVLELKKKPCFRFKGNEVGQLKQRLAKETCLKDFIVCTHNPYDGKLYPLKLHLPQNNNTMHIIVVPSSSKAAKNIQISS